MRLYHPWLLLLLAALLAACAAPAAPDLTLIRVQVVSAAGSQEIQAPAGSTALDALQIAGLAPGDLDRSEPPFETVLSEGAAVRLVRVTEEFDIEQVTIPFERRTLKNESLPEGESRLIQSGSNGLQEVTYRRVFEDNVEIARSPVKTVIVREPVAEIQMVGSQSPFAPQPIAGRLAYLSGGNAWVMEGLSGERRPVVTTGDLDGRIFSLSPGGDWLLFTRKSSQEGTINRLWAARVDDSSGLLVDLEAENVIHYAGWVPNSILRVAYSTVEPRATAPGWQANNDLVLASFSTTGWVSRPAVIVEANAGGFYGWWGTSYAWSQDGGQVAFVRPDGIGLVDLETGAQTKLLDITPLQTFGDWAWVPSLAWSPDGSVLFSVDHVAQQAGAPAETSPLFDLAALRLGGAAVRLVSQAGMFAYPAPSPIQETAAGERAYQVAYLQAIFPTQSETSRYRLAVMDRDGSNARLIFPGEGLAGLDPQRVAWSPAPRPNRPGYDIAVIYRGDLWLVSAESGQASQLTGDGLVSRLDWK
jgi:hypothetical protein